MTTSTNLNDVTYTPNDVLLNLKSIKNHGGGGLSKYITFGKKMVRISNHLPNTSNFSEGVEDVFFVFVNSNLSSKELDSFEDDMFSYGFKNVEVYNIDDMDINKYGFDHLDFSINRFLA